MNIENWDSVNSFNVPPTIQIPQHDSLGESLENCQGKLATINPFGIVFRLADDNVLYDHEIAHYRIQGNIGRLEQRQQLKKVISLDELKTKWTMTQI